MDIYLLQKFPCESISRCVFRNEIVKTVLLLFDISEDSCDFLDVLILFLLVWETGLGYRQLTVQNIISYIGSKQDINSWEGLS